MWVQNADDRASLILHNFQVPFTGIFPRPLIGMLYTIPYHTMSPSVLANFRLHVNDVMTFRRNYGANYTDS